VNEIGQQLSLLESGLTHNEIMFELKNLNAFPKLKYPRVLILELLNKDRKVIELSQKINASMKEIGLTCDKSFRPHITLGRVKREHKINLSGLDTEIITANTFSVNKFYLMESKLNKYGSEYSVIKEYLL
jgi:2'-5' RNA ligase